MTATLSPSVVGGPPAWTVLDAFGVELRRCTTPAEEVRQTLEAVAEAIDADCVFWQARRDRALWSAPGVLEFPEECRAALIDEAASDAEGLVLRHYLDPPARRRTPWPMSGVLARLGEVEPAWLVALRFSPHPLFGADDLHALRLTRRLLLNHRQRVVLRDQLKESLEMRVRRLSAAIDDLLREPGAAASSTLRDYILVCQHELDDLCRTASTCR